QTEHCRQLTGLFDPDAATVRLRGKAAEIEAQTEVHATDAAAGLAELLKNASTRVGGNGAAGVADAQLDATARGMRSEGDPPAGWRVPERVVEDVLEYACH